MNGKLVYTAVHCLGLLFVLVVLGAPAHMPVRLCRMATECTSKFFLNS